MRRTYILMIALLFTTACSSSDGSEDNNANNDGVNVQTGDMSPNNTAADGGEDNNTDPDDMGDDPVDMGGDDPDDMGGDDPDVGGDPDMAMMPDMPNMGSLYVGSGDPYAAGPLTITQVDVAADANGPPVDLTIYAPQEPGEYPVVVFQHGFNLLASYYSTMLDHVASHGFIIVAPQMYEPGFFGTPSSSEEAMLASTLYGWVETSLDALVGVDARTDLIGLVGHSRGAKVVWLTLEGGYAGATAAIGLDPVDGTGGPLGGEARVLDGGLSANLPSLMVGAELSADLVFGMACAPPGDDHQAFYEGAASPAYWAFGEGYGHLDMLNDSTPGCGLTCTACVDGPTDGNFRLFSAGQLVGFFRFQLQGDATAETYATAANGAPVTVQFMNK